MDVIISVGVSMVYESSDDVLGSPKSNSTTKHPAFLAAHL